MDAFFDRLASIFWESKRTKERREVKQQSQKVHQNEREVQFYETYFIETKLLHQGEHMVLSSVRARERKRERERDGWLPVEVD